MSKVSIGAAVRFTPSAFTAEASGRREGGKPVPRQVTGHVVAINRPHRFYTVEYLVNGYTLRESFKY